MLLSDLLYNAGVVRSYGFSDTDIKSIASDSRRVCEGSLFIAHKGSKRNGEDYISDAVSRGAVAVITAYPPPKRDDVTLIPVEDTRYAESAIWSSFFGDPAKSLHVVFVTGTNGKTTTSTILCAILRAAGKRVGLIGTVKTALDDEIIINEGAELTDVPSAMTTPDPRYLFEIISKMKKGGAEFIVIEASSHSLAQRKLDPITGDVGIFTNLSPEHLDFHGKMEDYFAAKSRLFDMCRVGIVNIDDEWGKKILETKKNCEYVGCSEVSTFADACARNISVSKDRGISYIYDSKTACSKISLPLIGKFNVMNSLLAVSAAVKLGIDIDIIRDCLQGFTGIPGRMKKLSVAAPFTVITDYAHTPAALENLLICTREICPVGSRIILLFGCGGDRDPSKRKPMGAIASRYADFVIITSDNPRSEDPNLIIKDIMRGIDTEKPHIAINDRKNAIYYALTIAREGDMVIFAGKGHENYEITKAGKTPFNEEEIARTAISEIYNSDD